MTLLYKDDWEETKQRYAAWWAGENEGRCGLWVTGSRAEPFDVPPPPSPPETPLGRWTDLDYHAARNEHFHAHTFYGGEAFPTWATGYPGHKTMAVFLGCSIELDFNTGWVEPILTGQWKPDSYGLAMAHFIDALETDQPFWCEGRDNLKTLALGEAAYLSAEEQRVVYLAELEF